MACMRHRYCHGVAHCKVLDRRVSNAFAKATTIYLSSVAFLSCCPPRAGDRAKFGLRAREIVSVVQQLKDVDMLDCLQVTK